MNIFEELFDYLELNEDKESMQPFVKFVKAMVIIVFLTAIAGFCLLLYHLMMNDFNASSSFGLIDVI